MRTFMGPPRGLTLIEIMGALAVSTLLLSGVWNLFQGGMQSYQRGMHEVRMTQRTRALLTLLTRDIQRAMAAHVPYGIHGTPDLAAQAGDPRRADRLVLLRCGGLEAPMPRGRLEGEQRAKWRELSHAANVDEFLSSST